MSPPRTRAGLSRASLARSAADLADEVGLRAVTVSVLARHVGVRPPSLYSHVADADDLRGLVAALALTDLADRLDAALAGRAGREAVVAFADVHRAFAAEHPGRFEATAALDTPVDEALAAVGRRLHHQSLAMLRAYGLVEADEVHAARLVAATVRGFIELERGGAFAHSEPDASVSWERALDALDATLRSWS